MIILFKILIIIGAVCTIFSSYKIAQFVNGKTVTIPGFEFRPDITLNGVSEETEKKLKKGIGWTIVVISDLIALFKLYVITWLI